MMLLNRFITTLLLCGTIAGISFAQSTFIRPVVNRTQPADPAETTPPAALPTFTFDLTAGQHPARFTDLENYLAKSLVYPDAAREYGIEGWVKVKLHIAATGEVTAAEILEGPGYGCEVSVRDLVLAMPAWEPASNYGIPVASKKIVEVAFRLE